ncbi:MAG TPA: serine hydrolase [Verrucomicrobiae bacterium]|nr:serine hydrolase [Verrucomicrobiae bacterium]
MSKYAYGLLESIQFSKILAISSIHRHEIKMRYVIVFCLAAVFSFILIPGQANEQKTQPKPEVLGLSTTINENLRPSPDYGNVTEFPPLTARSVFAYDINSGAILYTSNFDEKLPIASVTKIMTALVVKDKLEMNKTVKVNRQDIKVIGSNMGLLPDEIITVGNLVKGMLISSSNDAAKVLAVAASGSEEKFVTEMNGKAKVLGMNSTKFSNSVGLDSNDNYSTTYDLAKLVNEFIKHKDLSEITRTQEAQVTSVDQKIVHNLRTTNKLLLENPNVMGIKTGFTSLAKGNLVIRYNHQGADVITIVLGSDNREEDTRKLLEWITKVYKW